jgi:hypothetical protein
MAGVKALKSSRKHRITDNKGLTARGTGGVSRSEIPGKSSSDTLGSTRITALAGDRTTSEGTIEIRKME